jgi:hypothetical protein
LPFIVHHMMKQMMNSASSISRMINHMGAALFP